MEHPKLARTTYPIHEIIARRWSPRAFAPGEISEEQLGSLFEAARWAASSRNEQPWRFVYSRRSDGEAFQGLASTLADANRAWAQDAPLLVLALAKTHSEHNARPNGKAEYDTGQAVCALSLQASALGLYVHQMGGFSADRAREVLEIPEGYAPMVVLAIGYLGDPQDLPEDRRGQETAPRTRRPLSDLVFHGRWGDPAGLAADPEAESAADRP